MGLVIFRVDNYIIDIGFKFSNLMDPSSHINMICCKVLKILGFVMRLTKEFIQNKIVKMLYCALMRPILEYSSVIWDPFTPNDSMQLERVQRRFLRCANFILGVQCLSHDNAPMLKGSWSRLLNRP